MTEKVAGGAQTSGMDAELQAIRSLVKGTQTAVTATAARHDIVQPQPQPQARAEPKSRRRTAPAMPKLAVPQAKQSAADSIPDSVKNTTGRTADILRRTVAWGIAQIKAYRPVRKDILWTSLVLLLVLKPFMIIGWTVVLVLALWLVFIVLGADNFWRKVISMFQSYKAKRPEAARMLKLRAYVLAKKWDSLLRWLPDRMADVVRVPDLRELVKADARHHEALSDRLTRLRDDPLADV